MGAGGKASPDRVHINGLVLPPVQDRYAINVDSYAIRCHCGKGVCSGLEVKVSLPPNRERARRYRSVRSGPTPVELDLLICPYQHRTAAECQVVVVARGEGAGDCSRARSRST